MIKKPNRPSSNSSAFYLLFFLISFPAFFIFAIFINWNFFSRLTAVLSISIVILLGYYFAIRAVRLKRNFQKQDHLERNNLLQSEISKDLSRLGSLQKKIINFSNLKVLIEKLNACFTLIETSQTLSSQVSQLFGCKDITTILYIFHLKTGELGISASLRGQMQINLKNKSGDIFDQWVVKTMQPLIVEDSADFPENNAIVTTGRAPSIMGGKVFSMINAKHAQSDARLEPSKVSDEESRLIRSIISVPLMVAERALGILRVDSPRENHFNLEDLRFLNTVGSLAAIAVENVQLFERIEDLAIKDSLTGLYLRKYLLERMAEEIGRGLRGSKGFAFLMIDLDHFKKYNDRFGHVAGDIVLRTVAMILADHFRNPGDLVCRYGGEEFCVLLPDCPKQKASALAEQLRQRIEQQTIILRRQKTNVTISVGIAAFPKDGKIREDLIHIADQAMYKAKKTGRNKICVV